jgi:energy-coupling factor transporter ATP-binding protein EcfA2
MQLARLSVDGLFGRYDHAVPFPTRPEESGTDAEPSIAILHGPNGVGKTTVLRMLNGLMLLDFNVFRTVPFAQCRLEFSTGDSISVHPLGGTDAPLQVRFLDEEVLLSPAHSGPYKADDEPTVMAFRERFREFADDLNFDFIDTSRASFELKGPRVDTVVDIDADGEPFMRRRVLPRVREDEAPLARKVGRFIRDAQVDYRRFFSAEPELFPRIMARLTAGQMPKYSPEELEKRLEVVRAQAQDSRRLGLEIERWDYDELMRHLRDVGAAGEQRGYALTVLGAYTEFLESRAAQRTLVADRLLRFERIVNEFLLNKSVQVHERRGLTIVAHDEPQSRIHERQLSSGEHHLLYLMVAALTTQRRGTVIAIDEPELSMHIAWQRMLIRKLIECASNASPQFVFATHSPEIVADYRDYLIPITP